MRYIERQIMFREVVIAALGGGGGKEGKGSIEDMYCAACRKAKRDHCETCDREIKVEDRRN